MGSEQAERAQRFFVAGMREAWKTGEFLLGADPEMGAVEMLARLSAFIDAAAADMGEVTLPSEVARWLEAR